MSKLRPEAGGQGAAPLLEWWQDETRHPSSSPTALPRKIGKRQ